MECITIEECSLKDINKLNEIGKKTFYETFIHGTPAEDMEKYLRDNFTYNQLELEIKNKNSRFYKVENDDKIIAYLKLNFSIIPENNGFEEALEIQRIYIDKAYKGKGIGKRLIEKAVEIAKSKDLKYIWLGVWEKNSDAIKFYEKLGFNKYGTHIFKVGEDAQTDNLMKLQL